MNNVPSWLKDPAAREEWQKTNLLGLVARSFAAHPGCVTDEYVRCAIKEIKQMPLEDQYDGFELLETEVINGHKHGMVADVYQEISRARSESYLKIKAQQALLETVADGIVRS